MFEYSRKEDNKKEQSWLQTHGLDIRFIYTSEYAGKTYT